MFVPNCMWCLFSLHLMSFVLNVSKSCMYCSLALTQSDFLLNMVMCLAHESILVILPLQGLLSK
ncbi:hypothetical protein Hanom_Chr01g00018091 [Helianthus anomalus]